MVFFDFAKTICNVFEFFVCTHFLVAIINSVFINSPTPKFKNHHPTRTNRFFFLSMHSCCQCFSNCFLCFSILFLSFPISYLSFPFHFLSFHLFILFFHTISPILLEGIGNTPHTTQNFWETIQSSDRSCCSGVKAFWGPPKAVLEKNDEHPS